MPQKYTFLTVLEVSKMLRIHEMTAYKWLERGILPGIKIGGRWRVYEKALENFIIHKIEKQMGVDYEDCNWTRDRRDSRPSV